MAGRCSGPRPRKRGRSCSMSRARTCCISIKPHRGPQRRASRALARARDPRPRSVPLGRLLRAAAPRAGRRPISSSPPPSRRQDASIYGWTPERFIREGLLRFCFTDADDRGTQVGFVEQVVRAQLARHAYPLENEPGAVVICDDPHSRSKTFERIVSRRPVEQAAGDGQVVRNFYDLLDVLETRVDLDGPYHWSGNTQQRDRDGVPAAADGARAAARAPDSRRGRIGGAATCSHCRRHPRPARVRAAVRGRLAGLTRVRGEAGHRPAAAAVRDARRAQQVRAPRGSRPAARSCSSTSPSAAARSACC